MSEIVGTMMPYTAHVNLGIANGATLPDPGGLLEGTGKRHRHVKPKSPADLAAPGLRAAGVRGGAQSFVSLIDQQHGRPAWAALIRDA